VIEIHINPSNIEDEYLRHLNLAYGNWGDRQQFDWYFKRQTSYRNPDVILLTVDGRFAAGSGVSYRQVALPTGAEISVGVVTGAWTLSEFRNQGCFARVIQECVGVTCERGGALLLGFVRADNASSRQMARLGSAMFPTWYLRSRITASSKDVPPDFAPAGLNDQLLETIFERMKVQGRGYARMTYGTVKDFSDQFLGRPAGTEIVRDRQENFGVIEKRADADVLQLMSHCEEAVSCAELMANISAYSHAQGRELVSFTTLPSVRAAAPAAGFEVRDGFLTVLVANEATLRQVGLGMGNDSRQLAEPRSGFFLGPWLVHGGDRL